MSNQVKWNKIGLVDNPFMVSPPTNPEHIIWADQKKLKTDYEEILIEALSSTPSQVVLCRGPVGGGKTHASLYFSVSDNWPKQEPGIRKIFVIRVPTPKETGKPDRDFYVDIIENIGFSEICAFIKRSVEEVGPNVARSALRNTVVTEDFVEVLLRLGNDPDISLLKAYMFGNCTKTELRKLGLSRSIEKTQDFFRMLAGIFQCIIGFSDVGSLEKHTRVCLWLDEMEDFVYFSPSQYRPFGQGLRELVDRIPHYFSLFLNFTLTSPEEYEEIELILGQYLVDRVTRNVFFDEMQDEDMLEYVAELLSHYSTPERQNTKKFAKYPYYPFDEDALKKLLDQLPRRTPRNVNKRCGNAIMKAFMDAKFDSDNSVIDLAYVRHLSMAEIDQDLG